MQTTYGYIRVSTKEQNEDRQILAMEKFGVDPKNIVADKQSGKDFLRPGYKRLMRKLKKGDRLVIKSIDRLGRNYHEILNEWRILTKEKDVRITVIDMPILDTAKENDLTATLIADIVLQLLSYVAETERSFIRQRQREGIDAAKAKGVRFGRKGYDKPESFDRVKNMWKEGLITSRKAGEMLGVSHTCFMNWVARSGSAESVTVK